MSKARQLADLGNVYDDGALSNRNLIINGAMQVVQRGTSFTSNSYGLDHWYNAFGGTATVTQDTADVPSGFKYAIKTATSAASSFATFYQPFEEIDYERFKGQTVTISFYIKVNSTFVGNMSIDMQSGDTANTLLGGTWSANDAKTITPTTTWQRYEVTLTVATSNGVRLNIGPSQAQASGAEYSLTGVQLEVGDTATPFEHRSYGDELARCQRYYYQSFPQSTGARVGSYVADSTGNAIGIIPTTVPMRASPTLTATASDWGLRVSGTNITCTGLTSLSLHSGASYLPLNVQATGLTSTRTYSLRAGNTSARLQFDAEL
jgi:hypothetical protein